MKGAPPTADERNRIRTLRSLDILDTPPDERFDRLTRIARRVFDVPIALVSLVDYDRQWFKSRDGLEAEETPRTHSFCAHAILDDGIMVVPDAAEDARFRVNPLVVGRPHIRFYAGCPVRASDGSPLGTVCVIDRTARELTADDAVLLRDLAALVEQEIESTALATRDELTGLANRRGFHAIANQALALARRTGEPATLLIFDLDGFKRVNDTLGHAAGDRMLESFAQYLLATFRDSDVVARLGGDEFGVLLSGATAQDVARPLSQLEEIFSGESEPPISFSTGVAAFRSERHEGIAELMKDADTLMYEDKRASG